jgi:hypothetical protein
LLKLKTYMWSKLLSLVWNTPTSALLPPADATRTRRGHHRSSPANYLHLELLDLYRLLAVEFVAAIGEVRSLGYSVAAASASVSRQRACSDDTLMFRRAATARGESCRFKASKVARTML